MKLVLRDQVNQINLEKRESYSGKSGKDSGHNLQSNFLKKKKVKPSKLSKKDKEEELDDLGQTYAELNLTDYDKIEIEQTYCFCNGFSDGNMVKCDNDSV